MENIKVCIRRLYPELTKRQKLVAKYILESPNSIALYSAKEIGNLSGTSETTVIRLCYTLGFTGYTQLQEEIRQSLLHPKQKEDTIQKLRESTNQISSPDHLIEYGLEQDTTFIKETLRQLNDQQYKQAIDKIMKAKKIIVVGLRTSYAPANWLAYTLNVVRGNTLLYRGEIDDPNYLITEIDQDWLVIAISLPRYAKETISFVKAAKEKGAYVIGITDDELSPIGIYTDSLLKVITPEPAPIKGMPMLFSLLSLLITGIMTQDQEHVQQRINKYEETSHQFYPFIEDDVDR